MAEDFVPLAIPPDFTKGLILPAAEAVSNENRALTGKLGQEAGIARETAVVQGTLESAPRKPGTYLNSDNPVGIEKTRDGFVASLSPKDDRRIPDANAEFGAHTHVFFANGINTSFERAEIEGTMLAARIHQSVDLVYVRTESPGADVKTALHETIDPEHGKRNPPERALAAGIVGALDRGEDVHVVGFSRGALVTQLALESVSDHYRAQGHPSSWIEQHIAPRITVETFNGASHAMPPGVRAKHYVRDDDVLVAQSIGMGADAPIVRALGAAAIDARLALINDVAPEKRAAVARDLRDLASAVGELDPTLHGRLPNPLDPGVQKNMQTFERIHHDLAALSRDLGSFRSATPGADEILRDGYANTPNGPVISVGAYLDVGERSHPLQWLVDQHDLPQMIAAREPFESHPAPQARARDRDRGVAYAPLGEYIDHHVPSFRHKEVQHLGPGYREAGTIVDLDANRVLLSVREHGREDIVTLQRHTLEPMFEHREDFAAAIKLGEHVELSIDAAGKAHAQVLAPEHGRQLGDEHVRARTVSRAEGHGHER